MKIMIADDEPGIREVLRDILGAAGHEVSAASDGAQALEFVRANTYDVIVLDVNMPHMTGLEVLEHVRREKPELPVIMLTVQMALSDQVRGYEAQADYYLSKPFEPGLLLAYIKAAQKKGRKGF